MTGTYKQLVQMMKEVEFAKNSFMYVLHKDQVVKFVKDNEKQYETIKTKMEEISKKFMVTDEKTGNIITQGIGKDAKPVFKEGLTLEMYSAEFDKLMAIPCKIIV